MPLLGLAGVTFGLPSHLIFTSLLVVLLGAAIMAAVFHAEILAHYLGEPFGTLALAVTVIETSLIVSIMLSEGAGTQTLARDTLIAAIMITINAIVGTCLLVGGPWRYSRSYCPTSRSASAAPSTRAENWCSFH
mgnify:CR=1 FL=1